jgi:hypothetical protein
VFTIYNPNPARGKGPANNKEVGGPWPPWWVGGSEYEKGMAPDFFRYFYRTFFLYPPRRETPKNVIKQNREKIGFGFLVDLFCKNVSTRFFCETFFVVFLNSHR